jgi:uridine kinase
VKSDNHLLIGIAGGSGSGKTTFLRAIMDQFSPDQIAVVSQDNYYKSREFQVPDENGILNFDLPTSIDRDQFHLDMVSLVSDKPVEVLEYNFNNPAWIPKPVLVNPAPVIIMEGLFIFHFAEIREAIHYKVFLDAHHETRLERRIKRDQKERGFPEHEVRYQWDNHVRPAERQFMEPFRTECDLIVVANSSIREQIELPLVQ